MSGEHDRAQLFLDGRLDEGGRREFEAHLATCAECQALVKSWRSFSAAFAAESAPHLAPPDDLQTQRLLRRARGGGSTRRLAIAGAFVAVAAAITLVFVFRPREQLPLPVAPVLFEATTEPRRETIGDDVIAVGSGGAVEVGERSAARVEVRLVRGSVAAAVKKRAPGSSFVVRAGDYEVKVVGTRFRVERLAQGGVRVSVTEGLVRVTGVAALEEVAAGQTLELDSQGVRRSTYERTGFVELGDQEVEKPAEPVEVDAGTPVEALEPVAKPISAAKISTWREGAAKGKCTSLLPELQRAAREHRRQAAVWRVLADCQRLNGDAKAARVSYEQVISVGTSDDAARARPVLASLLQDVLADHPAAVKVLTEYLRTKPAPVLEASARVKLARSHLALGDRAQAKKELQRVVAQLPSSPPAIEALELLKTLDQ